MKHIPYGRQFLDKKDKLSVLSSLSNDLITTGPYVKIFENKTSNFLNNKYSLSCNSGTSALFLALQSIEVKENDVIIKQIENKIYTEIKNYDLTSD